MIYKIQHIIQIHFQKILIKNQKEKYLKNGGINKIRNIHYDELKNKQDLIYFFNLLIM